MKNLYVFLMIILIMASGCITTGKPVVPEAKKVEVGEAHGFVNHCPEDRAVIIDHETTIMVNSNTLKEVRITNGRHQMDFYQILPTGPKFYASLYYEVRAGEWLVVEMFPAQ